MTMNTKNHTVCVLSIVYAVVIAGCGGGGGGGMSSLANTVTGNIRSINQDAANLETRTAARAIPNSGSVTQSSNVDGSNVTLDEVSATATYTNGVLNVEVTNGRSGGWGTISSSSNINLTGTRTDEDNDFRQQTLGRRDDSGDVIVDVFTNRLNNADTNYLVGGTWLYLPSEEESELEIGAFLDSPVADTPVAYLRTQATANYEGDATGVFVGNDGGNSLLGEFVGQVELTAAFGGNPTVRGRIFDMAEIDDTRSEFTSLDLPDLTLGEADIRDESGGFFTGDTSLTDASNRAYTGRWGGQFYGDEAQHVGGTFGSSTSNENYDLSFVGVFAGSKEEE